MSPARALTLLFATATTASGCFYDWEVLATGGAGGAGGSAGSGAGASAGSGGGGNGGTGGGGGCTSCPVTLADDQLSPRALAVVDDYVYWANSSATATDPGVLRVPTTGGAVEELASGVRSPLALAVDDDFVYVTEYVADGRLMRVPRAGGGATVLDDPSEPLVGVAVDAVAVYYVSATGNLRRWPLPSGPAASLGGAGNNAGLITLADGHVYGTRFEPNAGIWRVPVGGGATEVVSPEATATAGIAATSSGIVYTVFDEVTPELGAVKRMGFDGGGLFTLASTQARPAEVAVTAGRAYWANSYDGTIVRGELDVGAPTVIASGQTSPNGVAVDSTAVFWTNAVPGGQVMKLTLAEP